MTSHFRRRRRWRGRWRGTPLWSAAPGSSSTDRVALTALLLFLAVPVFVIPQTPISDILDQSGWNREEQLRAESILDEATSEELPAEAIELRLREGIAKRVDPGRVLSVAADELSILRRAHSLIRSVSADTPVTNRTDRDGVLERTATLLRSGYEAAEITRLLQLSGGPVGVDGRRSGTAGLDREDRADTYRAVTALYAAVIEQGVQRSAAMDLVTAAIAADVPATDLPRVASLFTVAARSGYGPDRATGIIVESLNAGRSIPEITRQLGR